MHQLFVLLYSFLFYFILLFFIFFYFILIFSFCLCFVLSYYYCQAQPKSKFCLAELALKSDSNLHNNNNNWGSIKQAGTELGQYQFKLVFGSTSDYLYQIYELEILLARLTLTTICHLAQVEQSKSNFKWLRFG